MKLPLGLRLKLGWLWVRRLFRYILNGGFRLAWTHTTNLFRSSKTQAHILDGHFVGDDAGAGGRLRLPAGVRVDVVHSPTDTLVSSWRVQPGGLDIRRGDQIEVPGADQEFRVHDWYMSRLPDGRLRMVDLYVDSDGPIPDGATPKITLTT